LAESVEACALRSGAVVVVGCCRAAEEVRGRVVCDAELEDEVIVEWIAVALSKLAVAGAAGPFPWLKAGTESFLRMLP